MPKTPHYTKEALDEALEKINSKTMSLRAVAKLYCIPRATLQFKLKNPTSKSGFGPTPYLTKDEENSIEEWLIKMARKGFPRKADDVLDTVQNFLTDNPRETPFVNNRPGQGWLKAFFKRHPSLTQRTSEGVTKASANVTEGDIRKWFQEIRNYLTNANLLNVIQDPRRIFNADETGFQTCPSTGRVIAAKGDKNVFAVQQGNPKENVTVLFTFSANGMTCPPLIVFPYKRLPDRVASSVPPKWGIGRSDTGTGWMTADVFNQFITEIFAPYLTEHNIPKPVILFIDGHKSHITLQLSLTCKELGIELIALYPNTTRITQPADVSVFGPVKKMYRKAVAKFQAQNMGEVVTKLNIAGILKSVVEEIKPDNIINGFKACGLYPFDENSIDFTKCLGTKNIFEEPDEDMKLMSLQDFESIVGDEIISKMKLLRSDGIIVNESSPSLYKVWSFFQGDFSVKESTNIQSLINNSPSTNEHFDLSTPSTSKDIPHANKSINEYLPNPPENKRKFVRKIEKTPYVITSENFRANIEKRELEKQQKENEKIERKRKREAQAETRKQNAIEKTNKGKGVGKRSKIIKETVENVETEPVTNNALQRSNENKNVLSDSTNKIKILNNVLLITCHSCKRLALKNKSLSCSSCKKSYHNQCIPIKHREHIPDEEDFLDFICHNCYVLNDDSDNEVKVH